MSRTMRSIPTEFPVWLSPPGEVTNLRMVGPGLYVGNEHAPLHPPVKEGKWCAVLDLYGSAKVPILRYRYRFCDEVISLRMADGDSIPTETLDTAWEMYRACRGRPFLLHCMAGLSRSASVAYALLRKQQGLEHEGALALVQTPGYAQQFPMPNTLASARYWVSINSVLPEASG